MHSSMDLRYGLEAWIPVLYGLHQCSTPGSCTSPNGTVQCEDHASARTMHTPSDHAHPGTMNPLGPCTPQDHVPPWDHVPPLSSCSVWDHVPPGPCTPRDHARTSVNRQTPVNILPCSQTKFAGKVITVYKRPSVLSTVGGVHGPGYRPAFGFPGGWLHGPRGVHGHTAQSGDMDPGVVHWWRSPRQEYKLRVGIANPYCDNVNKPLPVFLRQCCVR